MSKWKQIKTAKEAALDGVDLILDVRDGSLKEVIVRDRNLGMVRFCSSDWNGITMYIPAPPEKVKRFFVVGSVAGLKVEESFETEREAEARREELQGACHSDAAGVQIEAREIEVAE